MMTALIYILLTLFLVSAFAFATYTRIVEETGDVMTGAVTFVLLATVFISCLLFL